MGDDYLWDRSGEPDPEIERLEKLLGVLRQDRPAPEIPGSFLRRRGPAFGGSWSIVAAAATVAVAVGGAWLVTRPARPAWEVTRLEAAAGTPSAPVIRKGRLSVGDWLETGEESRARIRVGLIGEVEIEPRTRVRLVDAGAESHRLSLARGILHALIWAPPGNFFVETPSAVAVDLGCAYTLEVDDEGSGLLRVSSGWVGFEYQGRESFVPAGALCATRRNRGPGTPYYEDASDPLKRALTVLDFEAESVARSEALATVLSESRARDAVTLWHLLARLPHHERGAVFDRLASLVPPPEGVTREGILRGEKPMLDAWWEALDLGTAGWWRLWKAPWPPQAK